MTNHQSLRTIADIATANYYRDINSIDDLTNYMRAELFLATDETIDTPADIALAIDRDIHDLLHNANLDMLLPDIPADLSDDDYDALMRRCDNFYLACLIARRLIRRFAA